MAKFGVAMGMFGVHNYYGGDARGYLEAAKLADAAGTMKMQFLRKAFQPSASTFTKATPKAPPAPMCRRVMLLSKRIDSGSWLP